MVSDEIFYGKGKTFLIMNTVYIVIFWKTKLNLDMSFQNISGRPHTVLLEFTLYKKVVHRTPIITMIMKDQLSSWAQLVSNYKHITVWRYLIGHFSWGRFLIGHFSWGRYLIGHFSWGRFLIGHFSWGRYLIGHFSWGRFLIGHFSWGRFLIGHFSWGRYLIGHFSWGRFLIGHFS